jgi:hypothetical protein
MKIGHSSDQSSDSFASLSACFFERGVRKGLYVLLGELKILLHAAGNLEAAREPD